MGLRAIAFDFDGVIADTTQLKSVAFLEMFEGLPQYSQIVEYEKRNQSRPRLEKIKEILQGILHQEDPEEIQKYLNIYARRLGTDLPKAPFVPGFHNFFEMLKKRKFKIFIVFSGVREEIETYLGKTLVNEFDGVFDYQIPKSAALKKIASDFGLKSDELLFLGDNTSDLQAAQDASCKFIGIHPNVSFPPEVQAFEDFRSFDLRLLQ